VPRDIDVHIALLLAWARRQDWRFLRNSLSRIALPLGLLASAPDALHYHLDQRDEAGDRADAEGAGGLPECGFDGLVAVHSVLEEGGLADVLREGRIVPALFLVPLGVDSADVLPEAFEGHGGGDVVLCRELDESCGFEDPAEVRRAAIGQRSMRAFSGRPCGQDTVMRCSSGENAVNRLFETWTMVLVGSVKAMGHCSSISRRLCMYME
jgi:hypothetical protein